MTKLIELLNKQKLTLIVSMPSNRMEVYEAAIAGGADAVKLHINVEHRASGNHFTSLDDNLDVIEQVTANPRVPVGIVPGDSIQKIDRELVERLVLSGIDFMSLYAHHTPAWLLSERRWSKMLAINNEYSVAQAISIASLDIEIVEASIMPPEQYGTQLSVRDLASYKRLAQNIDKPIVVPTQKLVQEDDLEGLIQTGVKGLMIGAIVTGHDPESIYRTTKRFKDRINELMYGDGAIGDKA